MTVNTSPSMLSELLKAINELAEVAGKRILEVYETEDFGVENKDDKSPLTLADTAAHNTIVAGLEKITPDWPILSEESAKIPFSERSQWSRYWLVDPLDGTREFIKRNGEFTVNIALIENQKPILGVVYVPVTQVCYFASTSEGAFKSSPEASTQAIKVRTCLSNRLTVAGSRSHADEHLKKFISIMDKEVELISIGSALKTCLVAEGKVDVYPRFGPTSEWDTAAAQCVVEQAGGFLTDVNLQPLRYNTKESLLNPYFFVYGDANEDWAHYFAKVF
jgi:3'(2'), 5'-bisphosphate nucleotidase